jgi:hypothetical protein
MGVSVWTGAKENFHPEGDGFRVDGLGNLFVTADGATIAPKAIAVYASGGWAKWLVDEAHTTVSE